MSKDIFGAAIRDYYNQNYSEDITVHAPDFDDDYIPVPYLFRTYPDMPKIEQMALDLAYGKVLDVGCGAGSHSLYLQEEKKLDVTGIDISEGAIEIAQKRGLQQAKVQDIFTLKNKTYDTLLFLMNGSGIIGRLDQIDRFFVHLKTLLTPNGQVLIDSSDISYLFTDEDGGFWVDPTGAYYGEMRYKMTYKALTTDWFDWLYIDYNTLQNAANAHGFLCELLVEGENNDYLAKFTLLNT